MPKDEESILQEAHRLTHGPRQADYGHPLDDYSRTAALINALFAHKLAQPFDAEDAAQIQMLVKLSRHQNVRKRDNMVDAAGYAWVTWACTEERERRENEAPDPMDYARMPMLPIMMFDPTQPPPPNRVVPALDGVGIAPLGTGPLTPMEFQGTQGPTPEPPPVKPPTPRGRLLTCGCFGTCTGLVPACPNWKTAQPAD